MKYCTPESMDRDQGSQFPCAALIAMLEQHCIQISGWQGLLARQRHCRAPLAIGNYEEFYLHGYDTVSVARQALNRFFDFYNRRRPHSPLDGKTLDTAYFNLSKPPLAAAT